jgi:hypothetical protein
MGGRKSLKSLGTKFGNFAGSCVFNVLTSIAFAVFSHRAKEAASSAVGGLDSREFGRNWAFGLDNDPDIIGDNSENGNHFRFFRFGDRRAIVRRQPSDGNIKTAGSNSNRERVAGCLP